MSADNPNPKDKISSDLVREDASFADIVLQFVEGLDERLTQMQEALNAEDLEALRRSAHQLKGSGGGYGYPVLTKRAAELEDFAKSGSLDHCEKTFAELKDLCSRVVVDEAAEG